MVLHLLSEEKLVGYGAHMVMDVQVPTITTVESNASSIDDITSKLSSDDSPIGIKVKGWRITSKSKSPIASEAEVEDLTSTLQDLAIKKKSSIGVTDQALQQRLLLHPPEIVFVRAYLKLQYLSSSENEDKSFELSFLPEDSLCSWASIHRFLSDSSDDKNSNHIISIIKSADSETWVQKKKHILNKKGTREFLFDWTYSTPYAGSLCSQSSWIEEQTSGIDENMHMLVDQTQPILMFDDIRLYEDDLHDNGEALLTVKIRVMPKCFYVLMRFFLRVDNVIVRCRDARFFHKFGDDKVFRDVTWREISWRSLMSHNLPTENTKWRIEHCQQLLDKLPSVDLPPTIFRYSSTSVPT